MNNPKLLKIGGILVLIIMILGVGCAFMGTADLRTTTAKEENSEAHAKVLLEEMGKAHGIEQWRQLQSYSVVFEDEFLNFIGRQGNPFPQDKTKFQLSYIPHSFDGNMLFLNGKDNGLVWGIQSWQTYTQSQGAVPIFEKDKDITFWLPTYQYFIEFPSRIQNANVFRYAGLQTIEGIECEGIFASWKTTDPQKDIDQYLIWISKADKRIVKLEYTIRELYRFLTGAAYFKEYKNYDGLWLPSRLPVESNLSKDFIHEMRILDFIRDEVSVTSLRPNSNLKLMGDDKE